MVKGTQTHKALYPLGYYSLIGTKMTTVKHIRLRDTQYQIVDGSTHISLNFLGLGFHIVEHDDVFWF